MSGREVTGTTPAVLGRSSTALLTTFRRDGTPVPTPVSLTIRREHAYFVTATTSGKARRLAARDEVTLARCSVSGVPLGPSVSGRARRLEPADRRIVRGLLLPHRTLFWSYLMYRMQGKAMGVYEVSFDQGT